ncbi:hypothetical protein [Micromonospora luteifusca]|uniref:hypothetical protein n=1 Tax=Micromonospora luteifusca TaxID=709860 RepID=UPI0033A846AF
MFSIQVVELVRLADSSTALGRITVGGFFETFEMSLAFWSPEEYRASWRDALEMLRHRDDAISCLVSSITDPSTSNFVFCWPLYRNGDDVFVQNAVVILEDLTESFDPARPWRSVRPHASVDEDGNRISEWLTDMSQVTSFLDQMEA